MILRAYRYARFRLRRLRRRLRIGLEHLRAWFNGTPPVGFVRFGNLRRLQPIAVDHGTWRGKPIDRYYIERFLQGNAADIHGRVLEIGERTYTREFGGDRVVTSDVLYVEEGNPDATIVADLTAADSIDSEAFDCILCTQTIQFVYDIRSAVRHLHRILRPGGVLLATTHGISQLDSSLATGGASTGGSHRDRRVPCSMRSSGQIMWKSKRSATYSRPRPCCTG